MERQHDLSCPDALKALGCVYLWVPLCVCFSYVFVRSTDTHYVLWMCIFSMQVSELPQLRREWKHAPICVLAENVETEARMTHFCTSALNSTRRISGASFLCFMRSFLPFKPQQKHAVRGHSVSVVVTGPSHKQGQKMFYSWLSGLKREPGLFVLHCWDRA